MNNVAGIDVSKGKSMVSVLRPFGEVVAKPFSIGHTGSELKELADYLKSLDGETRVVMEHTGRYYEPVARFLHEEGVFVSAVNPKLIKDYGNNTLRKVKTDKADARKIARYGLDNWAELRQHTPMDTIRMQLKTLNRQQSLYAKTKTMMKNNLIALLDQTYPGVNALFDSPVREDGSQKWVDFATAFWHVDCVRNMSLTAFAERYRKWCKRHGYNFSQSKAVEVHTGAQDLIAMLPKDALTKTMVRQAIDALNAVSASLERLKAEMQAPSGAGFERVLKQFSLSARPENEARSGDLLCRCCDDNLPVWSADVRVCVCAEAAVKVDGYCLRQRLRILLPTLCVVCMHLFQHLLCQFRRASSALS